MSPVKLCIVLWLINSPDLHRRRHKNHVDEYRSLIYLVSVWHSLSHKGGKRGLRLVSGMVWDHEVGGSNLLTPTMKLKSPHLAAVVPCRLTSSESHHWRPRGNHRPAFAETSEAAQSSKRSHEVTSRLIVQHDTLARSNVNAVAPPPFVTSGRNRMSWTLHSLLTTPRVML